MENVQIQTSDDGKWIYLAIKKDKIIGQTEKGSDKVAQAFWEDIDGTNLKVNLLVLVKKDKKAKAKTVADEEEAPAVNTKSSNKEKTSKKSEPVKEVKKLSRREREAAEAAEAAAEAEREAAEARAARKAKNKGKSTSSSKNGKKDKGRPSRPSRLAEPDYSNVDF